MLFKSHLLLGQLFKCIIVNEKLCILIRISLKFVPKGQIDHKRVGSGSGLAPNRRQAIAWTNYDLDHWRIYAALVVDESNAFLISAIYTCSTYY